MYKQGASFLEVMKLKKKSGEILQGPMKSICEKIASSWKKKDVFHGSSSKNEISTAMIFLNKQIKISFLH